jgi:hypothetical protein
MKKSLIAIVLVAIVAVAYFIGGAYAAKTAMREANLTTLNNLAYLQMILERDGPEKAKEKIRNHRKGTLEVFENFEAHPISLGAIFVLRTDGLLWDSAAEEKIIQSTRTALK